MTLNSLKEKGYYIEIVIIIVSIIFLGIYFLKPSFYEIKYVKKAEIVEKNLIELRVALEKYYQVAGHYPELTKEGAADNLRILDYTNEKGIFISFADIYGSNSLKPTEDTEKLIRTNRIIDTNDFKNSELNGGWLYDASGQTGEIHPNLPKNTYFQNIIWTER
ncbi:MAG: hypothetical protein MR673_06370 [Fusobacterium perfoetens]|uniref:hypothetical protein n=1 Tax=Fusobacterium perfoetens TaxID=852 RepID=UPI0023F47A61|nr:hypothetical protein [Fusobacterium perfoetens]MCI6152731.1 hypothetical protein [Fusobacterium perfoetens]MDY3236625.1 hypothetical protein [Fusobacterium perfoetens]